MTTASERESSGLAIVAGAGPGMGAAIARRFGRAGYRLALIARQPAGLLSRVDAPDGAARAYAADLTDFDQIGRIFAAIAAEMGPADVLVYNGALWREGPAIALSPELFQKDMALNVTGALACAQHVHPAMKARGAGTILFTGGGLALHPEHGVGVASLVAGKAALRGLTHVLARELASDGVHVASVTIAGQVAPGTALDPDTIAEHYLALHMQPRDDWETERVIRA